MATGEALTRAKLVRTRHAVPCHFQEIVVQQLCQPRPVIASDPSDLDPFRVLEPGNAGGTLRSERYADRSEEQF